MVNRSCEKSLMFAFQQQHKIVDDYMVTFVLDHEIARCYVGASLCLTPHSGTRSDSL